MKNKIICILVLFANNLFAQPGNRQIEITSYARMDLYPKFSYVVNSINTKQIKILGTSWGIRAGYKIPLKRSVILKFGAGYYRHAFNKIMGENRFGENSTRHINYPSLYDRPFFTDRYAYNCVLINIGTEKHFQLNNNWQLVTGINIDNYYTLSQSYHLTYNNPDIQITNPYKLKEKRFFGVSVNLNAGVVKQFSRYTIGPTLILPVFDLWMQDKVFPEEINSNTRNKFLGGLGFGITFNYLLNKKK